MGTLVLLRGMLRNEHHEVECELVAQRNSADANSEYIDGIVVSVFADLPDGPYLAVFDGHSMRARREHGIWLTTGPVESNAD